MNTWPLAMRRAMRNWRAPSRVHTPATRPKGVALASSTAWSSSWNGMAASTGPKTSSCARRCWAGTSRSRVVGQRVVHQGGPKEHEEAVGGELDPLGQGARDKGHGDHGEHPLEHGE